MDLNVKLKFGFQEKTHTQENGCSLETGTDFSEGHTKQKPKRKKTDIADFLETPEPLGFARVRKKMRVQATGKEKTRVTLALVGGSQPEDSPVKSGQKTWTGEQDCHKSREEAYRPPKST